VIVDGSSSVTTVCDDVSCRLSTVKISLYCLRHPLRGIEVCSYAALYFISLGMAGFFGTAVVQPQIMIL
jgi:hypothetical protein